MLDIRPKTVLVLRHSPNVGPGYLEDFLKRRGLELRQVCLYAGDALPDSPDGFGAVVVLGGEMNVYEEDKHPFLVAENAFIRKTVERNVPYLGLCLGGQLLAKAMEGKVTKNRSKEIGPYEIALTPEGSRDPLFAGFPGRFPFCEWHGDTFCSLPPGATLLASSSQCDHQAFRCGATAYGLQFHPEATTLAVDHWCHVFKEDLESSQHEIEVRQKFNACATECIRHSERLFKNFFLIARVLSGSPRRSQPLPAARADSIEIDANPRGIFGGQET